MVINFKLINLEILNSISGKKIILYADFNVLNFLYEKNIKLPNDFILYPDSTAVYLLSRFYIKNKFDKIISTDFQNNILCETLKKKKRIFLFGDTCKVLKKLCELIFTGNNEFCFAGFADGFNYDDVFLLKEINSNKVDVLFVGLGITRQEEWIIKNYKNINAEIIISVGGWFQYLSRNKKRAPKILLTLSL